MTKKLLQQLIEQYRVPVHIQKHMQKVAEVAVFLAKKMKKAGEKIDIKVVEQAALLHDVLKLCDFQTLDIKHFQQNVTAEDIHFWTRLMKSCNTIGHCEAAYNMLNDLREKKLAIIIRKHGFESIIEHPGPLKTWEEKLLYYADKRVKHDQVVTLSDRLADLRKRYNREHNPHPQEPQIEKAIYKLEQDICKKAEIKPEDISTYFSNTDK